MTVDGGTFWRLKSGRLVRVEAAGRGGRIECVYVDHIGKPLLPLAKNQVSLSKEFMDNYARRVDLASPD